MRHRTVQTVGLIVIALLSGVAAPVVAQQQVPSGSASLTIYSQNLALVRTVLDRILEPGMHTVQIDGLPTNFDQDSMMVTNPDIVLVGARDYRT